MKKRPKLIPKWDTNWYTEFDALPFWCLFQAQEDLFVLPTNYNKKKTNILLQWNQIQLNKTSHVRVCI